MFNELQVSKKLVFEQTKCKTPSKTDGFPVGYSCEDAYVEKMGSDGITYFRVRFEGMHGKEITIDALALYILCEGTDIGEEEHG